ncbi:MAG: DUF924 domain-containing protein [Alphaproteobacteria bacterium]|nr:DUF924 domain-containing protein [Alphaproteobacteria bacterium]
MADAQEIIGFWVDEVGPEGWYNSTEELDARIHERFGEAWEMAAAGDFRDWVCHPDKALALLILLDQFPRNMFRGSGSAFRTDRKALCVAKKAIERGYDLRVDEPLRQFFYLPLMHSECLTDQERCVRLMKTRMPNAGAGNLLHAKVHREVIRKFGRFPYRNDALNRDTTAKEVSYLNAGGYGETMREVQAM